MFNNLIELVTSCGNYSQYRKRFTECSGFRFPILGVHLKDLIAVHVALPDWADKEKTRVNLTKTQQLYTILQELAMIQTTPPSIDANTDLLNLLTVSAKKGTNTLLLPLLLSLFVVVTVPLSYSLSPGLVQFIQQCYRQRLSFLMR